MTKMTNRSALTAAGLKLGATLWALARESPVGAIGVALTLGWILIALGAPILAPFPPNATLHPYAMPGTAAASGGGFWGGVFWLGTDHIGRDILSRIIWGSRTVLLYSTLATGSAYLTGIAMGLTAAYFRGWVDEALSSISNLVLAFPPLVLYILIIGLFGSSGLNIILAVTVASAPLVMRITRGLVLEERERDYVAAAQMRGESAFFIMLVEILPNVRGPLIVEACLRMGYVTLIIGVLGFLGLGLPPPQPDWGGMVSETRSMALAFPHMVLFPCLAISSLVLGLNLLADGFRELSPRP